MTLKTFFVVQGHIYAIIFDSILILQHFYTSA